MTHAFIPASVVARACTALIEAEHKAMYDRARPIIASWAEPKNWFERVILRQRQRQLTIEQAEEIFWSDEPPTAARWIRSDCGHRIARAKRILKLAQAAAMEDGDGAPVALDADDAAYLGEHLAGA